MVNDLLSNDILIILITVKTQKTDTIQWKVIPVPY